MAVESCVREIVLNAVPEGAPVLTFTALLTCFHLNLHRLHIYFRKKEDPNYKRGVFVNISGHLVQNSAQ